MTVGHSIMNQIVYLDLICLILTISKEYLLIATFVLSFDLNGSYTNL